MALQLITNLPGKYRFDGVMIHWSYYILLNFALDMNAVLFFKLPMLSNISIGMFFIWASIPFESPVFVWFFGE